MCCSSCLRCFHLQCGNRAATGWKIAGDWKIGNYLDECQAEYFVVPGAQANLAVIPDSLTDEDVFLVPDIVRMAKTMGADIVLNPPSATWSRRS